MLTISSTSKITDCAAALSRSIRAPLPESTTMPHFCGIAEGDWSTVKLPATASKRIASSRSSGRVRTCARKLTSPLTAKSLCTLPRIAFSASESTLERVEPSLRRKVEAYALWRRALSRRKNELMWNVLEQRN